MAGKKTDSERIDELEQQVAMLVNGKSASTKTPTEKKSATAKTGAKTATAKKPTAKSSTAKKPATESAANEKQAAKSTAPKNEEAKSAPKKTAAKKPAAKKSASEPAAAKSTAPKKTAAKKPKQEPAPAVKQQVESEPDIVDVTPQAEEPIAEAAAASEPVAQEQAETPAEPVAQEQAESETAAAQEQAAAVSEPVAQEKAETPAEPVAQEKAAPEVAATVTEQKPQRSEKQKTAKAGNKADAFAQKSRKIVDKGRLPLFITANALMLVAAVLLVVFAFDISHGNGATKTTSWYTLFGYFANAAAIKPALALTAGSWGGFGYVLIGIFMALSVLVMLALIIKNVVILLVKKDRNVYLLDALITFAFMLLDIAIFNMFGVNVTAGQIVAFVISILLVLVTSFMCTVFKSKRSLPILSIITVVLTVPIVLLLTSSVYGTASGDYYAANAAAVSDNFTVFVFILFAVLFTLFNAVIQLLSLPKKFIKIIASALSAMFALFALILAILFMPSGMTIGIGFLIGTSLDIMLAVVCTVFVAVKPLAKYSDSVASSALKYESVSEEAAQPVAEQTPVEAVETVDNASQLAEPDGTEKVEEKAEPSEPAQPTAGANQTASEGQGSQTVAQNVPEFLYCTQCGKKNVGSARFCSGCGNKMRND